jgi:ABC-type arginine/histidine transport system permease subunit
MFTGQISILTELSSHSKDIAWSVYKTIVSVIFKNTPYIILVLILYTGFDKYMS